MGKVKSRMKTGTKDILPFPLFISSKKPLKIKSYIVIIINNILNHLKNEYYNIINN